ncbi:hypothetical protein [Flavobacterium alkalisoli]|uniref:hypothetical protein n=1 Tax=Flavobacterium alkalisoli TaxID=2602769 RepID=UPI003A8EE3AE
MKHNKLLLPLLFFILFSCTQKPQEMQENLIITVGSGMDPSEPRYGIELKGDTLFYCEEINPQETFKDTFLYKYYYCIVGKEKVNDILNRSKAVFDNKLDYGYIDDANFYQIDINTYFDDKDKPIDTLTTTFYLEHLEEDEQLKVVNDILALKDCDLKPMKYHLFNSGILQYRLPPPPPPVKMNATPKEIK